MTYYYDENGTRHVITDEEAADKLQTATETIEDLRGRVKWLENENAKLQTALNKAMGERGRRERALEELVMEMLNLYCIGTCECYEDEIECKYKHPDVCGCRIWSRASELGIEVDG